MIRGLLLSASESAWLRRRLAGSRTARRAVLRFMPGEELEDAVRAARELAAESPSSALTYLGEHVSDPAEAERAAREYERAIQALSAAGLSPHVSVKPSHLGLDLDPSPAGALTSELARRAGAAGGVLWLDMEDSAHTNATIALYRQLRRNEEAVGLCLQAYLRRTPRDLADLLALRPRIRIVKGAYREPAALAYENRRDVDASFLELAVTLLRCRAGPALATHDLALLDRVETAARTLGMDRTAYEVQMLYGIRAAEQHRLARQGYRVRVLIAYGSEWFAWYVRRLAERPANLLFALRAVLH